MACIGPSIIVLPFGSLYKLSSQDVFITLHNFTTARERPPEATSTGKTMRSPPHPPQTGDLNISLTLENIRNQRKNYIRQLFFFFSFFGNYRSPLKKTKQEKKKDLCWREGTEDFGSKCSVQTRTHLTCAAKSIHPLPCSPFSSSIFTSMVKISSHLSSQLKLNGKS